MSFITINQINPNIEQFVNTNFKLNSNGIHLYEYNETEWNDSDIFLNESTRMSAVFTVESLTANIRKVSPYFQGDVYHEYYGHGLFYKESIFGKKIVMITNNDNSLKMSDYADKYNDLITYKNSEIFGIEYDDENERMDEDAMVFIEAIAYYFEYKLMTSRFGDMRKWMIREKQLKQTCQYDLYLHFLDEDGRLGTLQFLKTLGF